MNAHIDTQASQSSAPAIPRPRARARDKRQAAYVSRSGDTDIPVYASKVRVRGKTYTSFVLAYYANGKRQRRRFPTLAQAKVEADLIAGQKAQGALGASALDPAVRIALQDALTRLASLEGTNCAQPARLVEIVDEYAGARAGLPTGVTLKQTADFYLARHPINATPKTVAQVVAEFVADRESAQCSAVHVRDLRVRLGQFSKAFPLPINNVQAPLVQTWLNGLKREHDQKPVSARTKKNVLRNICALFKYARRMKHIPADLALEIREITTPKSRGNAIGIYTADEIRALLAAAGPDLVPVLAIGAFAGLRIAELTRLDWKQVRLAERLIVVEADQAKTATRRLVPITDNLLQWLTPHYGAEGSVGGCADATERDGQALGNRLLRTAARAGVQWKRNGLRHSFISYRVAVLKDVPAVALEAGNSPAMIFSNYRALASEAEGQAWFAIQPPPAASNIVALSIAAAA
jgi:integrase